MKPIPIFYFPSTFYLVDDHARFPNSITNYLTETSRSIFYARPSEFIEKLSHLASQSHSFVALLEAMKENLLYDKSKPLLGTLQKYLSQCSRFEEYAVVSIDYSMAQMNGLEVAKTLPSQLEKILLTGEADHTIALRAFNEGIIDRFIRKDADALPQQIDTAILDLGFDYFYSATRGITGDPQVKQWLPDFLYNLAFRQIFIQLWRQHHGVEFYLINREGDFLCFTADAKPFQLSFRSEKSLGKFTKALQQIHKEEPCEESETAFLDLNSKKSILLFPYGEDESSVPTSKWRHYSYALHKNLMGKEIIYYAYTPLERSTFSNTFSLFKYQNQ